MDLSWVLKFQQLGSLPMVTWLNFGYSATSQHLQPFAVLHHDVTTFYDDFAKIWHLLPVFSKTIVQNNYLLNNCGIHLTLAVALQLQHSLNNCHKKVIKLGHVGTLIYDHHDLNWKVWAPFTVISWGLPVSTENKTCHIYIMCAVSSYGKDELKMKGKGQEGQA